MLPGAKGLKIRTESIIADEVNIEIRTRSKHPLFFERSVPQTASVYIKAKHTETKAETKYQQENEVAVTKPQNCPCNIL